MLFENEFPAEFPNSGTEYVTKSLQFLTMRMNFFVTTYIVAFTFVLTGSHQFWATLFTASWIAVRIC